MNTLYMLENWLSETTFYKDYLSHMPAPFNNLYFDTILLAIGIVYAIHSLFDAMQMRRRHKQTALRQEELKVLQTQNEIDMLERERIARNQQSQMDQFLRIAEVALISSIRPAAPTTVPSVVYADPSAPGGLIETMDAEKQRLKAEIEAANQKQQDMLKEFKAKELKRQEELDTLRQLLSNVEAEKHAEIEQLTSALDAAKADNETQLRTMMQNLSVFKAEKEREIIALQEQIKDASGTDDTDKQLQIDALVAEMEQLKADKQRAIDEKELELTRLSEHMTKEQQEKEAAISALQQALSDAKQSNETAITSLQNSLNNEKAANEAMAAKHLAEINRLNEELSSVQAENAAARYEATHDALTGMKNRAGFEADLKKLDTYALIAFDVNDLKKANDVYGHAAGDKLLTTIASEIRKQFHNVYRMGGDEFNVLIPDAVVSDTNVIKQKLSLLDVSLDTLTKASETIAYRVAYGVSFSSEGEQKQVLALADERMYADKKQKKQGRDIEAEPVKSDPDTPVSEPIVAKEPVTIDTSDIARTLTSVTKTIFADIDVSADTDSEFARVMNDFNALERKTEEIEASRRNLESKADEIKQELAEKFKAEAIEETTETRTVNDDVQRAIEARKQQALEIARREEEAAKRPKKKSWFAK